MKWFKRITAGVLALALVLTAVPFSSTSTAAAQEHSGRLWLGASRANSSHICTATCLHMTGTDKLLATSGDISAVLIPNDENSGIWLNGQKTDAFWILKYHGANNSYMLGGLDGTATPGTTITIEGSFKCQDQATYTTDTVKFQKSVFVFNGAQWTETVDTTSSTSFKLAAGSNASGIYFTPETADAFEPDNWGWAAKAYAVRDGVSGVYVDGTWVNPYIFLLADTTYYLALSDIEVTATNGTTVVIKGKFGQDTQIVDIAPITLQYDGSAWNVLGASEFQISALTGSTYVDAQDSWHMYFSTSVSMPGKEWNDITGFQVSVNDGTAQAIAAFTDANGAIGFYLPGTILPKDVNSNYKITIKAGEAVGADGTKYKLTKDFTLYVNQEGWSTDGFIRVPVYKPFEFTGYIAPTGFNQSADRWDFYLTPSVQLPGNVDTSDYFDNLKVKVKVGDDAEKEIGIVLQSVSHQNSGWFALWPDQLEKDALTKGFKLTVCAGKFDSSNTSVDGIELTKDFTIYANQYGWSTTDFVKAPVYDPITFTGYDESVTQFLDNGVDPGWHLYLDPSTVLPGENNDETMFMKVQMSVNGDNFEAILVHSSYQGKGFILVPAAKLPKEITGNTTLVIKAGKYDSNNKSNGIEITKDFTIYANQYGWSTTDFVKAPTYTKFSFKGMDGATAYNATADAWDLYLTPDGTLPGKSDGPLFSGLQANIGGKTIGIGITKSSHYGTAFIRLTPEELPKVITKDTKIVIKAGKALSTGGVGIELTKDFTIYANQYGWSTTGFLKPPTVKETNISLAIDRYAAYGGTKDGIYLTTTDHFPVDTSWATRIQAVTYDVNSGVFLNGKKLDSAGLIRYYDGKMYISLSDIGITAKDHDVLTVKGVFALNGYGVSYKEANFHFNGKIWDTTYKQPAAETYKKITIKSINSVSGFLDSQNRWNLYFDVDTMLPGEIDRMYFHKLTVQVGTKTMEISAAHSYNHTLFFAIPAEDLAKNCKDGTQITIKAGKALGDDQSSGIELTKDFKFYTYKGTVFTEKPTTNTDWQDTEISQLIRTGSYNAGADAWQMFFKLRDELKTETGTRYLQLPVVINGKQHLVNATQEGIYLYVPIYTNILPANTKSAEITIKAGAKTTANAGKNGIHITKDWTGYLFNGAISETKFTEVQEVETGIIGLQAVTPDPTVSHVYLRLNREFPGSTWYEYYNDFEYYYNGRKIETYICKADSSNHKVMYFTIDTQKFGQPQEGDLIRIKEGEDFTCGGYHVTMTNEFCMIYKDGVWSQYVESDVKKPEDVGSIWSVARFDPAYIPVADANGSILLSGEDKYPEIQSLEKMKDYTVSFNAKKAYDDEIATTYKLILRGNPISENDPMTTTLLYGYVITFSPMEVPNPNNPEEMVWSGYLELWKNGENMALTDQYRIHYEHIRENHPFFEYDKDYQFEFSIYNVTDTCVCIEAAVNGKTIMRCYDEAGSDPFDPAINEGTFAIVGAGPTYITDDAVELDAVIAEKDACETGEEVRVAATYPAIIEGAEFKVNKKGATVKDGIFKATEAGTYKISCTYNGKELAAKTIEVTKSAASSGEAGDFPVVPVAIGAGSLLLVAAAVLVIIKKKKK